METLWRIALFGGLQAQQGDRVITRFRTYKTAALLGYLAYYREKKHSREVLAELLWSDSSPENGRRSLTTAVSSLRHQLEPPGVPAGTVIRADRFTLGLNPAAVTTDVREFEALVHPARQQGSHLEQIHDLTRAADLYQGELLPGYYEAWIAPEQHRLADVFSSALRRLVALLEQTGDPGRAIEYARRWVQREPLEEEAHRAVMRLLAGGGQPAQALGQYRALEQILREELDALPDAATRTLASEIERAAEAEGQREERMVATPHLPPFDPIPLPIGTATFLLTDIEEPPGEAFRDALEHHRRLLRQMVRRYGGHVVKEIGEGFMAAFGKASEALRCAVACQKATSQDGTGAHSRAPLRVRMALDTGEVGFRESEYQGAVLDRACQVLLAGHGGQILCSEEAAALLRRGLEPGMRLKDLGVYRLGSTTPERLFQVEYPEMPVRDFPPLRAEAGNTGHLPLQLTRFFGREEEIAHLKEQLLAEESRLLTLTGPPGSGKTRLALEAAGQVVEPLRGAVWFVPLADISNPGLIIDKVLEGLHIPRSPQMEPLDQVAAVLSHQPGLLVLDNFEHLLGDPPDRQSDRDIHIVRALLERAPALTCMVTSRQRLNLAGERVFEVLPLPTPEGEETPESLAGNPCVQLFVDRAQAVRPDFQVTQTNGFYVKALCVRLEGIPLALELAAARCSIASPARMLEELIDRFGFLVSRHRDVEERHRTLRGAIDWSCRLMTPGLRRFFQKLSVFRGGWDAEAAEAVCREPSAPECLERLVESSLVLAAESGPGMRYRTLESFREYGREQMSPRERRALERRHAEYYLKLAEEAEPKLKGPEQLGWLSRLETEQDNLRAALEWSLSATGDALLGLRLAGALGWFWYLRSHCEEGDKWLALVLARTEDQECGTARAKAIHMAGWITRRLRGSEVAHLTFEQGLALARELADPKSLADTLTGSGQPEGNRDFASARLLLEEALSLYREIGDAWGMANALNAMGNVAWALKDLAQAGRLFEESLGWFRQAGDRWGMGWTLHALGRVTGQTGDNQAARLLYEESLSYFREMDYVEGIASALSFLAYMAIEKNDYPQARLLHEEREGIWRRIGFKESMAGTLTNIGEIAYLQGEYEEAIRLHQESLRICQEEPRAKDSIPSCLLHLALAVRALGQAERAARLIGAADALREGITSIASGLSGSSADKLDADLRQALDEAAFIAAWEAGRKMTLEEAVEYALKEG